MRLRWLLLLLVGVLACDIDRIPTGLRATPDGNGPRVRFDLVHTPLPDVPLPNDVLTVADPTSRTGRRIDLALGAKTTLEKSLRAGFHTMEGWGVTAPITVAFDRSASADPNLPAIDLDGVRALMTDDEHDPTNDPVYLVNLTTGIPVLLDVDSGAYPLTAQDPARFIPNDPQANEPNLVFPTGDDSWYERATDTLVLRPLLPLEEKTEYAVVLTDRLRGPNGQPVRSPFSAIHHPLQRSGVTRLQDVLNTKRLTSYYGDLVGTGLEHVAFAWTFTTQPTREDLRVLRDGLYGRGPFAHLAHDYSTEVTLAHVAGTGASAACTARTKTPFLVKLDPDVRTALRVALAKAYGLDNVKLDALDRGLDFVDHLVVGTYSAPYLLGDPSSPAPDAQFSVDYAHGTGDIRATTVPFLLAVPRARDSFAAPFSVVAYSGTSALDVLRVAGDYARQGIAVVGRSGPGRGLALSADDQTTFEKAFADACLAPLGTALLATRANAVSNGSPTAHLFRARDEARQDALEGVALVRLLRSFDGRKHPEGDVAGDFDGDGKPDIGGSFFAAGEGSAAIAGGLDAYVIGAAPSSPVSSFAEDVLFRSTANDAFVAQVLGPVVFVKPASAATPTQCSGTQRSVRTTASNGLRVLEVELGCLEQADLGENMSVVITNVTGGAVRCATTTTDGRFSLPLPTSASDKLDVQIYTAANVFDAPGGSCHVRSDAPIGKRITDIFAPADGLALPRQSADVRRFRDLAQAALDPADPAVFAPYYMLRPMLDENGAPVPAHALLANSTIGDAVTPVAASLSFARAAGAVPFLAPSAAERMPEYADYATPNELYERLGRRSALQFLVENHVAEGVGRLAQTKSGPACRPNRKADDACADAEPLAPLACEHALYDPDWLSEGRLLFDEPHPDVPLRLGRIADVHVVDSTSLAFAWEPRLRGTPLAPDDAGWTSRARVVGLFEQYVSPNGAHGWDVPSGCRAWDFATYANGLLARFFASGGKDVYYLSHPTTHGCLADASCNP